MARRTKVAGERFEPTYLTPRAKLEAAPIYAARLAGVRLWLREDRDPKVIQSDATREHGRKVLVRGSRTRAEAEKAVAGWEAFNMLNDEDRAELGKVVVAELEVLADLVVVEVDFDLENARG